MAVEIGPENTLNNTLTKKGGYIPIIKIKYCFNNILSKKYMMLSKLFKNV